MLICGDAQEKLKRLIPSSVDACVTDPPYGLAFMGKHWDYDVPSIEFWKEVIRVMKPGAHLLAFGGTRTYHRMVVNIEDAGFEIRDQIQWIYGSGFPKSHDVSKGVDKRFGRPQKTTYTPNHKNDKYGAGMGGGKTDQTTKPITERAKQWEGFGTALKPANEPIVLARKPLARDTVVKNVLKHKTGALNIDACRIESKDQDTLDAAQKRMKGNAPNSGAFQSSKQIQPNTANGRWPANVIFDEEAAQLLDEQSGVSKSIKNKASDNRKNKNRSIFIDGEHNPENSHNDSGGASRFFYCPKASKSERNKGLEGMEEVDAGVMVASTKGQLKDLRMPEDYERKIPRNQNNHPTVKPIKLMEYLVKLVNPPGGTVLDPFMGSGSTGVACKQLGFNFIGIELDPDYFEIAKRRML